MCHMYSGALRGHKRSSVLSELIGVTGGYELPCGCWGLNPSALQEQRALSPFSSFFFPQNLSFALLCLELLVLEQSPFISLAKDVTGTERHTVSRQHIDSQTIKNESFDPCVHIFQTLVGCGHGNFFLSP